MSKFVNFGNGQAVNMERVSLVRHGYVRAENPQPGNDDGSVAYWWIQVWFDGAPFSQADALNVYMQQNYDSPADWATTLQEMGVQ